MCASGRAQGARYEPAWATRSGERMPLAVLSRPVSEEATQPTLNARADRM